MAVLQERVKEAFFDALGETFEEVRGMYLDRSTSLFETLETISAQEASQPVGQRCASIAAQVEHVRFYLDVLEHYLKNEKPGEVDWNHIWNTVEAVTPDEWDASKTRLKTSYQRVRGLMSGFDTWEGENDVSASMSVIVHTAYHLGEIRQALCTVKQS
jgi:hypothetical protein